MHLRKPEEIAGGVLFLLSGLIFLISSLKLGVVSEMFFDTQPGAGYYPAILSGGLILLGAVLLGRGLLGKGPFSQASSAAIGEAEGKEEPFPAAAAEAEGKEEPFPAAAAEASLTAQERRANVKTVCLTAAVISAALLLWRFTGFYPAMIVMCVALNVIYRASWLQSGLLTAGTTVFIYVAFTHILKITFKI